MQEIIKFLSLTMFGFFSYFYFFRLLGVKKNVKSTLIIIVLYLVFFDNMFLGQIVHDILTERFSLSSKYNFIYFLHINVSQICFTVIIIALFKGDILKKVAICTNYFVICELVGYGISPIFQRTLDLISDHTITEVPQFMFTSISVLRYVLTCILLHIISKRCENLRNNLPRKISAVLCILSLFILFMLEFIMLVCNEIQVFHMISIFGQASKSTALYDILDMVIVFVTSLIGLFADLIIIFGLNHIIKQILIEKQLEMQVDHYRDLDVNNQNFQSLRHDMKNHIITISSLLKDNNVNTAKEYMNKLTEESGLFSESIQSGNNAVDALLNTKLIIASNCKIKLDCDIKIPKLLNISDFDLCIILGNAVDNALEACKRMVDSKECFISIQSSVVKSYLVLQIKNSTVEKKMEKDTLISKKITSYAHGIGLENIKSTIIKNHGTVDISLKNYTFSLSLMLPINRL